MDTLSEIEVPAKDVVGVISNTLNLVDPRLVNHGRRVAELMCRALWVHGGFSRDQLRDLCLLSIIHDIGAYKTDEIDKMVHFESTRVWQHAIYGFLFVRHIRTLSSLAPIVLFHHADHAKLRYVSHSYHELAQILHIADRIDMVGLSQGRLDRAIFESGFSRSRNIKFSDALINLFDTALFDSGLPDPSLLYNEKPEFTKCDKLLEGTYFDESEVTDYLNMLVHSIDFRSPQTVPHTVGVAAVAEALAGWFNLDASTRRLIHFGSLVHDLGKQGIPLEILEADRALEPHEFEVMRSHVMLSEQVLTGYADQRMINIAVRHHEKINGKGYHHGVAGEDLTFPERLVAVADVLSALLGVRSYKDAFPKEKVLSIINSMSDAGHLDPVIVGMASTEIDRLIEITERVTLKTRAVYEGVQNEYKRLLGVLDGGADSDDFVLEGELF